MTETEALKEQMYTMLGEMKGAPEAMAVVLVAVMMSMPEEQQRKVGEHLEQLRRVVRGEAA